jgi:hypothetical protein
MIIGVFLARLPWHAAEACFFREFRVRLLGAGRFIGDVPILFNNPIL